MEISDNIQIDDVAISLEAYWAQIKKSFPCQFHWAKVMDVDHMQYLYLYKDILTINNM